MLFLLAVAGCGGAQPARQVEMDPLGQARAVEVIEEAAASRDLGASSASQPATLVNGTEVSLDVYVRALGAGFLYLNEQDRRDYGPMPEQAPGSELHAVLATLPAGEQVHVLVLQDLDFQYLPNPRADHRRPDEPTIDFVVARLRRDTLDFIQAIVDLRGGLERP